MLRHPSTLAKTALALVVVGFLGLSIRSLLDGKNSIAQRANSNSASDHRGLMPDPAPNSLPSSADITSGNTSGTPPTAVELRWQRWLLEPRTIENIRAIEDWLKELACKDPNRAMDLALGETDPKLRQDFRDAVLRGWASESCDEAANWAMRLPAQDHHQALEAVFAGAISHPLEASNLGRRLCAQDPTLAGDYGQLLIVALAQSGQYETAARFAATDTSDNVRAWLNTAYYQWATYDPEQATRSFERIIEPEQRRAALQGIAAGWSDTNPAALATYVMRLEPGEDRAEALGQTLTQWVNRDPVTASEWLINNYRPSQDLDRGTAKVATLPSLIGRKPEIAVAWAESISDPELRADTLQAVAREWALQNPDEVRRFISANPNLSVDEYRALSKGLEPPSPDRKEVH